MCNDFGNNIPYTAYLEAFSELPTPVRFPRAAPNLEPRDDIWPTDTAPVIRQTGDGFKFVQLRWDFPPVKPKGAPVVVLQGSCRWANWPLAGATVVLNGRTPDKLEQAAQGLHASGITVELASFDVTDQKAVAAGIERIENEHGSIDVLVNNAGIQRRAPLEDFPPETWRELMRTNLDSVFFVSQAVAKHMIPRKRGKIINIGSVQSELARPSIAPYAASKGAVKMLTKGMCADWAPHGLQVNGIGPGYFETELTKPLVENAEFTAWLCKRTPAGRWGRVEELMGAAVFLASAASDFVNGHMLYVDGGMTSVV